MGKINRSKIIDKLNILFSNYEELSAFCNELSNDMSTITKKISIIIKYGFIKEDFLTNTSLYVTLLELSDDKDVDDKYKEYLMNKSSLFSFGFKKRNINMFSFPLDSDIDLDDIKGLRLPSIEYIEEICKHNIDVNMMKEKKKHERDVYYAKQMGFSDIGFEYTRPELITINPSFIYCGTGLSGDINKDYVSLYNDDRYGRNNKKDSPLNDDFNTNIEKIKRNADISMRKLGNLYEIKNGRHRIIYILSRGNSAVIPAQISKRIEDRETNIILSDLRKNYNVLVFKNNLLNDEANILLITNNFLYEIRDKDDLLYFYSALKKGNNIENLKCMKMNIINHPKNREIVYKYRELIYKKYLEVGDRILTGNFTDVLNYFSGEANSLFYEAFRSMQYDYQYSLVHNYDFNKVYQSTIKVDTNDNFLSGNEVDVMHKADRKK